jgi:hypothetical protein
MKELVVIDDAVMLKCAAVLRRTLIRVAPTQRIKRNVVVERVQGRGNSRFINIRISAPEVRAFEYGSGLHATKGPRMKYIIRPRRKKALYFYWEKAGQTFVGKKVMHPGIQARPFIAQAKAEARSEIRKLLKENGVKNIRTYLRVELGKAAKVK